MWKIYIWVKYIRFILVLLCLIGNTGLKDYAYCNDVSLLVNILCIS